VPGPLVLPGTYRVKLTANGHELTQTFGVRMDPRSVATAAELAEQFKWAQAVYVSMTEANRTIANLTALASQTGDASRKARCQEVLAGKRDNPGLQSIARTLNALLGALESADRTPPSQVISAYRETAEKLTVRLKEANQLTKAQ